jgi:hypothetical protein
VDEDPGLHGGLVAVTHMATTSPGATRIELAFPSGRNPTQGPVRAHQGAERTSMTSSGTPSAQGA